MNDIRADYEECAEVPGGKVYRKGHTIQVWWEVDKLGRPLKDGRETWTLPSYYTPEQIKENFDNLVERWRN